MSNHLRVTKVLAALLISMTGGAMVLMALGNNPPSAGPFCLASYYRLDPVEEAIVPRATQSPTSWKDIEVYYSNTQNGNLEQLSRLRGLNRPQDINCHFCLCNGHGGNDGQIQTTERWHRQLPTVPTAGFYASAHTIRICVIADRKHSPVTERQVRRTQALIQQLRRAFNIAPQSVRYPDSL
jgi:hypothetical protein